MSETYTQTQKYMVALHVVKDKNMCIVEFCNNNIGFMSILLTTGLLICAIAQFYNAKIQKDIELNRLKIIHADEFIENWNNLYFHFEHIENYKAKLHIPKDYGKLRYCFFRFLEKHLEYTKCYYNKDAYEKEKELIKDLHELLPQDNSEEYIFNLDVTKTDSVYKKYMEMYQSFIKSID